MTGLRILIITYNWPPRNAIGTQRPYAWAKYWSESGHTVTVLTSEKYQFDAPLDLHYSAPENVRVIEVPYGGASIAILDSFVRSSVFRKYIKKIRIFLGGAASSSFDPRSGWREAALSHVRQLASENDIVVSTYGPESCHLLAYEAKKANSALTWVADYRDLWSQNHQQRWSKKVRRKVRSLEEETVGRCADIITAVSEEMALQLRDFCDGEIYVAPNGFDVPEEELNHNLASPTVQPSNSLRIVYTGTVYANHRDPTPLLETLANMVDKGELAYGDVVLEFYGSRVEPITRLMENSRFEPFLRTPGHVSREEAIQIQRKADLLLLLESTAPEARGVLTGKIFEYMAAGKPILCVGSRAEFEIGLTLKRTGTGIIADSSDVEQTIRELRSGEFSPKWFTPDIDKILEYSRRRQSLNYLENIVNYRSKYAL